MSGTKARDIFSSEQTLALLNELGVSVVDETETHWMVLCPFHGNMNTPAMVVDKEEGVFLCNNAACDARGTMRQLIRWLTKESEFKVELRIARAKDKHKLDVSSMIGKRRESGEIKPYDNPRLIDKLAEAMWKYPEGLEYMRGRGFEDRTLREFHIGYSPKKQSVQVPMYRVDGVVIGMVGRSIHRKGFYNSAGLKKKETLWNIHNARKQPTALITEATFDAMKAWQATGYHAVATLGSHLGQSQADQLRKYFTRIIILTDDDPEPEFKTGRCRRCLADGHDKCKGHYTGLELGKEIASACHGLRVEWGHLDSLKRFGGAKDLCDLTDAQVKYAVDNSISHFEMMRRVA